MTTEVSITEKGPDAVTPAGSEALATEAVVVAAHAEAQAEVLSEQVADVAENQEAIDSELRSIQEWQSNLQTRVNETADRLTTVDQTQQRMLSVLEMIAAQLTPQPPSEKSAEGEGHVRTPEAEVPPETHPPEATPETPVKKPRHEWL